MYNENLINVDTNECVIRQSESTDTLRMDERETSLQAVRSDVWKEDQKDFVPTRQTISFDEHSGAMLMNNADGSQVPVDSYMANLITRNKQLALKKRRYLFLVRELKDRFIVTSYLTNIRVESINDFRQVHRDIIEDFSPYVYNDDGSEDFAREYLKQYLSETSKTFRAKDYEDVVLIVNIKERVGDDPMLRKMPLQFEVEIGEEI